MPSLKSIPMLFHSSPPLPYALLKYSAEKMWTQNATLALTCIYRRWYDRNQPHPIVQVLAHVGSNKVSPIATPRHQKRLDYANSTQSVGQCTLSKVFDRFAFTLHIYIDGLKLRMRTWKRHSTRAKLKNCILPAFRNLECVPPPRMKLSGNQQLECLQGHMFFPGRNTCIS